MTGQTVPADQSEVFTVHPHQLFCFLLFSA